MRCRDSCSSPRSERVAVLKQPRMSATKHESKNTSITHQGSTFPPSGGLVYTAKPRRKVTEMHEYRMRADA
eukprot:5176709-Pleurochrysis_carterae.AAC.1